MKHLLLSSLTLLAWLVVFSLPRTFGALNSNSSDKPNFSGDWTVDLEASTSIEPLMTRIGASLLDRKYVAQTKLKATLEQTDDVLKVATRGPSFALNQTLYLDGRNDSSNQQLLGATSVDAKTTWSQDHKQLIETHHIRTKEGKEGQLIIKRSLMDDEKTLVVAFTLKLNGEPNQTFARQIWRKQA